jgi:hypothetical protein
MKTTRRCSKCLYLRHLNDARATPPDTCPRCQRVYDKVAKKPNGVPRKPSIGGLAFLARPCTRCNDSVSIYALTCSSCGQAVRAHRILHAALAASILHLCTPMGLNSAPTTPTRSPLLGVSDATFTECQSLSADLTAARLSFGTTATETLRLHNDWHRACSRKALRGAATNNPGLPTTPEDWLAIR